MEELKRMIEFTGMDAERLVNDYRDTLRENNNPEATKAASIMAIKEWVRQKEFLIRQVMSMPGYNGNLQSVGMIEVPYERTTYDTDRAISSIWNNLFDNGNKILSKIDDNGKTIEDYIKEELKALPNKVSVNNLTSYSGKPHKVFDVFTFEGYTKKSITDKDHVHQLLSKFKHYVDTRLTRDMANSLNAINPDIRAAEGMKTTRALGKIIKLYGLEDKSAGSVYGREFIAKYCEIMKEGGLKLLFVVSCNPIDYLKMSIGEFTSCHNIRGGGWRSGTISYMLDKVTMITYTVRPNQEIVSSETGELFTVKERPELFMKMHRNVFHWDEDHRLIQSRVYPQAYDGTTDLYTIFRHETQKRIAQANGWETEAWTQRKRKFIDFTVGGEGHTNYQDWSYEHFGGNLSTPGHSGDPYATNEFVIGAKPMCIVCGNRHERSSAMRCGRC